ncbi:hypothetical protein EC991_003161 [Linnemannia zychae]|nr:hypothetical protein EC991_003161 [Linnemannia zychae]
MVPQHDIHITWPHPVPSGNAFIAGTWSVPGHGPWEKLPMTRIPGTDSFEVHLNVQEIEDISDYLDEDGYLHHELLDHHHHAHDHTPQGSPPLTPTSTTSSTLSRRKRLSRLFGRARSSSSASTASVTTASKDLHIDLPHHHQSKDGTFLPILQKYRYQYKFVIDDEWKCDHDRPQVQDSHGHWNHELVVELIEQTPSEAAEGRSRSSSLQSQHGPQLGGHSPLNKSLPTPHPTVITTTSDPSATTTATTTIDTPTSIIISPAEEDKEKEEEIKEEIPREAPENAAVSTPVPASSAVTTSAPVVPAIPTSTTTTARKSNIKSRDTYEAILIFDETDDLSDGEGRSKGRAQVESDDDGSDEEYVKEDEKAIEDISNNTDNNNSATELLGDDVVMAKVDVTPQQDDHAVLSPADQDNCPLGEESSAADTAPASDSPVQAAVSSDIALLAEGTIAAVPEVEELVAQAVEEKKYEAAVEENEKEDESATALIEDIFVNSSSVAEPLPQLDEPSFVVPAGSNATEEEVELENETVVSAPIAVEESAAEVKEQEVVAPTPTAIKNVLTESKVEDETVTIVERALEEDTPTPIVPSLAPASVAIPASPVFSFSSTTANSHLLSPDVEPQAFVLQAAADLEGDLSMEDDGSASEAEEPESSIQDVKPATTETALEITTNATTIATAAPIAVPTATVATATTTAAPLSVTTTATDYSQVPSPPLTPSALNSSKHDLIAEHITIVETSTESEKQQQQEETFERPVYMTPRAENAVTECTTLEKTTTAIVEDESATIDILEDKELPASLLSGSSSTSSLSTLNGGNNSRRSANSSTSTKHNSAHASSSEEKSQEVVERHDKKKGGLPEQYPNLFWSICKTTAVVSAAVVILGLGLGRRRD